MILVSFWDYIGIIRIILGSFWDDLGMIVSQLLNIYRINILAWRDCGFVIRSLILDESAVFDNWRFLT